MGECFENPSKTQKKRHLLSPHFNPQYQFHPVFRGLNEPRTKQRAYSAPPDQFCRNHACQEEIDKRQEICRMRRIPSR